MIGIIYKITNNVNNKVYIGQTTRTMESRFKRHLNESLKNPDSKYHIQRAIRKYGAESFKVEKIDEANTQEELNKKEIYWIKYYNSIVNGYNEAVGGQGGNTYAGLSEERLNEAKQKISTKNKGANNGMSHQIKCKSVISGEEHHFDTLNDCLNFFSIKNKGIIMKRANREIDTLFHNEWLIALEENEYANYREFIYDKSCNKGVKVTLISKNESLSFNSKNKAIEFLNSSKKNLVSDARKKGYYIYFTYKGVSTIPDECKGVELEISTNSERKAI